MILIALCGVGCDNSEVGADEAQSRAPLPPNTRAETPLSSVSQESGMSGAEICDLMTRELTSLYSTDATARFVCGASAMSASINVPEGGDLCDTIYRECRSNYTVTTECDPQTVAELEQCSVPVGVWQGCIDEQYAVISAAGKLDFSCGDLPGYISGLESIGQRYSTPSCDEIQRACPNLNAGSSSDGLMSAEESGFDGYSGDGFGDEFEDSDEFGDEFDEEGF